MLKVNLSLALLAGLVSLPVALHADTYNFLITTQAANNDPAFTFTASGTLSGPVDPYNNTAIDVTSITGSANGYNFLGVVDPGTTNSQKPGMNSGFTFNNVLYTGTGVPHADATGFLLYLDSPLGTSLAHVYYTGITTTNPGGYEVDVVDPNEPGAVTPFSVDGPTTRFSVKRFSVTPVPEPSTLALFGTGLAGLAGLVRRRLAR